MNDRTESALFVAWFAFCALLGLVALGLCAWAVITVVNWLTITH